jgi:hypothetical protein
MRSWPNFKVLAHHSPGCTEDKHENFIQYSLTSNRDLNLGLPEYEAGMSTTSARRSVSRMLSPIASKRDRRYLTVRSMYTFNNKCFKILL